MKIELMKPERPSDDYVASIAYSLWNRAGAPEGLEMEFWTEAEEYAISIHNSRPAPDVHRQKAAKSKPGPR